MSLPKTFIKNFHDEASVKQMEYHILGNTGLEISKISLGGGTLSFFYGELEEEDALKTIDKAIRKGINYIDTAPWYGQGKSEEILGKALKNIPREAYYIGTKIGRYELDIKKQFDFSAETTKQRFEERLKLLGLDYIDVIQIHDVEFADNLDIIFKETLPVLEDMVKAGRARFIGVTGYPLTVLKQAILGAPGRFDTCLTYTRYSLIDNSLIEYLPFLQKNKLGVICASVHAMGLLTNAGPQSWHPASDDLKNICKQAAEICKENDVELGKLALYYALQFKGPTTFLIGMQTEKLLDMNFDVLFNGITAKEKNVMKLIQEKYFSKIKHQHWEGVEVGRYWDAIKKSK